MLEFEPSSVEWYVWVVAAVMLVCFLIQLFYWLYYYAAVLFHNRKRQQADIPMNESHPKVSVIICAKDESENLHDFLPSVLAQDYPDFEVIIVNDGSTEETNVLIENWRKTFSNLYVTYLPENARVLSRKKLALTIGIKAAKGDILLLTDADCEAVSKDWISLMTRNFVAGIDFVVGYGAYRRYPGFLNYLITYDTFTIALQYMGFALRGAPYMGVGRNLAYRRQLFFDSKGFAPILHLQSGDDDLFVARNANWHNVRVEYMADSKTVSEPKKSLSSWLYQKRRHLSTSPYYAFPIRFKIGLEVLSRTLFFLSLIALWIFAPLAIALGATLLYVLRLATQLTVLNLSSSLMKERHFYTTPIVADILLPLFSLKEMLANSVHGKVIYKWK